MRVGDVKGTLLDLENACKKFQSTLFQLSVWNVNCDGYEHDADSDCLNVHSSEWRNFVLDASTCLDLHFKDKPFYKEEFDGIIRKNLINQQALEDLLSLFHRMVVEHEKDMYTLATSVTAGGSAAHLDNLTRTEHVSVVSKRAAGMKILVTGVTGLVGKDIARYLSYCDDYEVHGVGRRTCYVPNISYEKLDLTEKDAVKRYLDCHRFDAIVHCAALAYANQCADDPEYARAINVRVTQTLAEQGCRMIFCSSNGVFDGNRGDYKETDEPHPIHLYGETKVEGERMVLDASSRNAVLRLAVVYGVYADSRTCVTQWAAKNIRNREPMNGFTDVIDNYIHTSQVAEVVRSILEGDFSGVLHVGGTERLSRYDYFMRLADKMGICADFISRASVDDAGRNSFTAKNTSLDVSKLKTALGLEFNLEDGLERYYQEYLMWL